MSLWVSSPLLRHWISPLSYKFFIKNSSVWIVAENQNLSTIKREIRWIRIKNYVMNWIRIKQTVLSFQQLYLLLSEALKRMQFNLPQHALLYSISQIKKKLRCKRRNLLNFILFRLHAIFLYLFNLYKGFFNITNCNYRENKKERAKEENLCLGSDRLILKERRKNWIITKHFLVPFFVLFLLIHYYCSRFFSLFSFWTLSRVIKIIMPCLPLK